MVTVKEVAEAARVSPMTVSRVINSNPKVNPVMRERVLKAIDELGYVPNTSASRLRNRNTGLLTVGVILRDSANPFSAELQRSIEDELRLVDSLALTSSNDDEVEQAAFLVKAMRGHRVNGIILAPPPGPQTYLAPYVERGFPIVLVDRPADGVDVPYVASANFEGMVGAVKHLAKHRHRRIAYLGDLNSEPMQARYRGFQAGLEESGIEASEALHLLEVDNELESQRTVLELLESPNPPTAFIGGRNNVSIGILAALHAVGKQSTVAHMGFDDLMLADSLEPGFTAVVQKPAEIGKLATKTLLSLITGETRKADSVVVPTELIPRGSGEIPPFS